jgi:hypothetical protein
MEKLEAYLNEHPEVAKLIDLSYTEFGADRPDKEEAYYLVVNAVPLTLELDYQPTGTGSTEFVVSLEAPKELLEEAREKAREKAGGRLKAGSWYPLHPALKAWVKASIQEWERDYARQEKRRIECQKRHRLDRELFLKACGAKATNQEIDAWLCHLTDILVAEIQTRLLLVLMEDQKNTREILIEIRNLLKSHTA